MVPLKYIEKLKLIAQAIHMANNCDVQFICANKMLGGFLIATSFALLP